MPYMQHVYRHLRPLALILCLASFLVAKGTSFPRQNEQKEKDLAVSAIGRRPFYAIAHRVLTIQGLKDALGQGANAVEVDVTAWPSGWLADHDGTATSAGDTVENMFNAIAAQRRAGQNIIFVWLDIKNPNRCDPKDPKVQQCSMVALQEQARRILEPADVRVLYGFYGGAEKGVGYDFTSSNLTAKEAINLDGKAQPIDERFESSGIPIMQRVLSYGTNNLPSGFGNCYETDSYTCTELRQAVKSKKFGQVYGWTLIKGQKQYNDLLLGDADVDGMIYGFGGAVFSDHENTRAAFQDIENWVKEHPEQRYLATAKDFPW